MPATSEHHRLDVLDSYDLLGTIAEAEYDQFTALGATLFEAPICLVSLVGETEQWLKSHHGLDAYSTPRAVSFCAHTLTRNSPLVILDATLDDRFCNNALVTGDPHIRFYAGAPLINAEGVNLGAFCVIDTKPRSQFSSEEARLLVQIARMVTSRMEQRRLNHRGQAVGNFADATTLAIVTSDVKGRITFWNQAAETTFGYPAKDTIGHSLDLIVPERFWKSHLVGMQRVANGGETKLIGKTVEIVAVRRDGSEFPIEITLSSWEGRTGREFGAQIQDITARRARDLKLEHLARHDPLTGLTNRLGFRDNLAAALLDGQLATVFAIDLDGFKSVNDSLGHPIGDALLQAVAIRLTSIMEDTSLVARIGGDEFAILLTDKADPLFAHEIAARLIAAFEEPFQIAGHALQVGLSIGISMAPLHAKEVDELMLRADLALFASKRTGGRRFRFFDISMSNQLAARRAFKDELRIAAETGQWELFYQPQMRLRDQALVGVEALLRWRHPTRGLLSPAAFIDILETHPVAYEVGTWVIDEACRQLAAWRLAGRYVPRMSVNLFTAQFTAGNVEQVVSAALEQHALHPADLEIEITEKIALRPDDQVTAPLAALREVGVHIALDDFGTGFASLVTLKQLPVSRLKIDKSFVEDICDAPHSAAIVSAIVSLGQRLDIEVVAEGIEQER